MIKHTSHWYGKSDHSTSPKFFFYDVEDSSDLHAEQMSNVRSYLQELCVTRDGNGDFVAQMIYETTGPAVAAVAFRFTSDWAYRNFNDALTSLGLSIGRGIWAPLGGTTCGNDVLGRNDEAKRAALVAPL